MTTLQLPPIKALDLAIATLSCTATPAERRTLIKIQCAFHEGVVICDVPGAFLVRSFTSGEVYRVAHTGGCSCAARVSPCKHETLLNVVALARNTPAPMPSLMDTLDRAERLIRAKQAEAAINELFNAPIDVEFAPVGWEGA